MTTALENVLNSLQSLPVDVQKEVKLIASTDRQIKGFFLVYIF